jgi:hypothetical protein
MFKAGGGFIEHLPMFSIVKAIYTPTHSFVADLFRILSVTLHTTAALDIFI